MMAGMSCITPIAPAAAAPPASKAKTRMAIHVAISAALKPTNASSTRLRSGLPKTARNARTASARLLTKARTLPLRALAGAP